MILLGILILLAIGVFGLVLAGFKAPEGWEDEEGFHYGKRPGPWGQ